jgi:hypothetical protein
MKRTYYLKDWKVSSDWIRNLSLLITLTVGVMLNSAMAQRISTSGGTYTIDNTGTNTGTNFTSFTDAINDLNFGATFTGNVVINVTAGQSFTENAPVITATGNSSATITFVKSGAGANPLITSNGTTSFNGDAAIVINGGDYFTFNGIDVTAADSSLEFGYLVRKASFNNAAQFNTITNCKVLMSKRKTYSYAILQSNDSIISATNTAFNSANNPIAQTNNNNTYTSNTIGNAYNGIWLKGISTSFRDSNNICSNNNIGRVGVPSDIGALSGFTNTYGIYGSNQFTYVASNNVIKNYTSTGNIYAIYTDGSLNVTHSNNDFSEMNIFTNTYYYIYGIYLSSVTNGTVTFNSIHDMNANGTSNNYLWGIYSTTTTNVQVSNNSTTNISGIFFHYGYYMATATNSRMSTNTISNITTQGQGGAVLFYMTGGNTDTVDNNSATNLSIGGSFTGIQSATSTNFRIYNNSIQNVLAGSAGFGGVIGMTCGTPNNANIFNNTIRNVKSLWGGSASTGMTFTTLTGTSNIYNNIISDFGQPDAATTGTSAVTGAALTNATTGTVTINFYNNVINGLTKKYTGAASATRQLIGLNLSSTTGSATCNYYIVHNSISVDGAFSLTGSSTALNTGASSSTTSPIITFRNNIFANQTGAQTGIAKHFLFYNAASGIIGRTGSSSNYNDWYLANTTNGFFGFSGADKTDLAAWIATTGLTTYEANSVTGNPLFNSSTNSRLLFGSPAVNTGSYISGFDLDVIGSTRSSTTPSMGAYEVPLDETKPVINYTPAISVFSTANYTLTNFATISDGVVGAIPTGPGVAPRVYYKTKTNANAFVGNTSSDNGWKYVEASNSTSPFSFTLDFSLLLGGTATTGDTIQYFVVATDTAAIANLSANPSAGFVGTSVGSITSAPTTPNYFVVFGTPAAYVSADVVQNIVSKVGQGTSNNQIIRVKVTTALTGSPAYVSQLDFSTLGGGNDSANIASASVYYTGSSSTFATTNLFGTTVFSPIATGSIGAFNVTGNALCPNGDNYFWLVYNMRNGAVIGDSVDGELTSVTYFGTPNTYTGGATAGNRIIRAEFCASIATIPLTYEDIGNVTLVAGGTTLLNNGVGTPILSNSTAVNGYTNFTTSLAPVTLLQNQTINASIGMIVNGGFTYNNQAAIYIDYNQDGDFVDAGEMVWNSTVVNGILATSGPFTGNFVVPCTATTGETRMRVVLFGGFTTAPLTSANSCGTYNYGETEDYAVIIGSNPVAYVASNTIQNTSIIAPNTLNAQVLRIPVKAAGCGVGLLTDMHFNTGGSTNAADIAAAKLYVTGNTNTFNTSRLLGTVSAPSGAFSFTGLTDTLLLATNDTNNYWLAYDVAPGATTGNVIDAVVDSIGAVGVYAIPTNNNPAGSRLVTAPMTFTSSTTTQSNVSSIERGSANNRIVGLEIVTSLTGSAIDLTSLEISTNGTDSLPDITNIKVWYTGNSSTFATTLQFGSTVTAPAASNTVTGTLPLANGTNYIWVTYDINSGAALLHNIDAEIVSATIGGVAQIPTVTSPVGTRKVRAAYCASNATIPATYEDIGNVTLITNSVTVLNNGTGTPVLSNTNAVNGYTNFTSSVAPANILVNQAVTANIGMIVNGAFTYNNQAAIYVDYNQDGDFLDAGEMVWNSTVANGILATAGPFVATFTPPCTATLGETRMRVVLWGGFTTAPLVQANSCGTYNYGETEDYLVNIGSNPVVNKTASVSQNTAITAPAAPNAQILRIPVIAGGCGVGLITEMYFNTAGSTNALTDIVSAKLYSTGTSPNFNTTKQVGSTVSSPNGAFSFTGLMDTLLTATNDTNNYWLAYEVNAAAGLGNVLDARVDSIQSIGAYIVPTDNDPTGSRLVVAPMTYLSSTASHPFLDKVAQGDVNANILKLEIVTSAIGSAIDLTSLDISTNGTDSLPDITNLRVWYTGNSNVFATTSQFGTTVAAPAATNTVTGLVSLANGSNYFWVTYNVISGASIGHVIDAELTSATIATIPQTPTVAAPSGNRMIRAPYCNPLYASGKTFGDLISNIVISGTTLSNNTGTDPVNPAYTFFTGAPNLTATMVQGGTYNVTVSIGSFNNQGIAAWVDYNDDGVFSPSEKIGSTSSAIMTAFGSATFPITLTCASVPGQRRMRVRGVYANGGPTIDPCISYGYGETEDYIITIANNPVAVTSSRAIQSTGVVAPGSNNARVLRVPVTAGGCGSNSISEFRFSTTGTTATSDVVMAKLYSTGNSAIFNTNKLLGSVAAPSGQFVFNTFFDTLLVTLNDTNNYWLTYDISGSATEFNFVDATVDSLQFNSAYSIPTNNDPAGNRQIVSPMTYVSSTVTQPVLSKVGTGETNNVIARYEVTTSVTGAPIQVSAFDVATTGTTALSDITNLKVFYTGTSNVFATTTQFGTTVAAPAATQTVTGDQGLANGTNYFWVTYDISGSAVINNVVDAEVTGVVIDGVSQTPTVSAPAGTRQIRNAYCASNSTIPATYEDIGNVTLVTAGTTVLNNGNPLPTLSNPAAINGYTNFTALPRAQLMRNQAVDLSIAMINFDAFTYNDMAAIYIDYNQDGDFADVNEMVWFSDVSLNASTGPFTGSFTVPNGALLGETRMRVVLWGGFSTTPLVQANSCGTYNYGETEDYTIEINNLPAPTSYTWNQTGSANFNTASNWTPARTVKLGNDILIVNGGGNITMTNVPNNTVKSLNVTGSTNLTLSGSAISMVVFDTLSIEAGSSIDMGTNTMVIGTDTTTIGTIVGTGSLSGRLKRWINSTTTSYGFPIYVSGNKRSLNITYTAPPTTAGSLTLVYTSGAPGAGGMPTTDASLSLALVNVSNAGIWNLSGTDGLLGGTYTMVANADNIANAFIPDQTALVYRSTNFDAWTATGTGIATTGTSSALVLTRDGYNVYGQFGIAGTSSNPLPVKLTSFTALAKAKDALLSWTTVSETNNRGFEIERSLDGRSFESAGFVKGAGNSNRKVNYAFTDVAAFTKSGVWYYRLKQVDFDGKFTYSQIVKVSVNTIEVSAASVYPNPFKSDYTLSFSTTKQGVAQIELMDMQGRVVSTSQLDVAAGTNAIPVTETASLKSGIYFLKVTINGESQTIKLVKE